MNTKSFPWKGMATAILLLTCLLPLKAQDNLLSRMAQLRETYGIHFIYDASLQNALSAKRALPAPAATLPLEEALRQAFDGSQVSWQLRGRNVVLKAGAESSRTRRYTLSGHITDAASGETLIGAGVLSGQAGAATNEYGFYSLTLSAGRHALQVAYIGYDPVTLEIDLQRDTTLNFALSGNEELEAARIVSRKDAGLQSTYLGSLEVPLSQIRNTPVLFGEADVIKALQLLPGVQGSQEGFSGLYVRGGGPEENLILLDGVSVYNMDHMLGLFSVFQPEAVKNVTLYKGSFPARYGGRISSIVDIRTNDGNMKETHGSLTVGVLNDRFHLEGPIVKDKLSYSLSTRGLHSVIAAPFIRLFNKDRYFNYYFYDINGKLTWRATDQDRFYLSVYQGADNGGIEQKSHYSINDENGEPARDVSSRDDIGIDWGSTVGALRWNHIFSNRLFANTTLSVNRYRMTMSFEHEQQVREQGGKPSKTGYDADYRSGILDFGARIDFDWTPVPNHLVKFGAEYTHHIFHPETLTSLTRSDTGRQGEEYNLGKHYQGEDSSIYAEDNISLGNHLTLNPGLRLSWFNTQGRDYLSLQPRFAAKYSLDSDLSFKAGYSRMAQYVHLLSSTAIALPLDLWVPITEKIGPVTADHYSVGAYYDGLPGWEFSLEGYWKEMYNLMEYKEGVMLIGSSDNWEEQVETGRGRAYGLELFVQKTQGKTTGWIAYTLSRSERWFPNGSINMGRPFPYKYDRPHAFNLTLNHKFSEKVDVSISWIFSSGSTLTLPMRKSATIDPNGSVVEINYVESRNNFRLPPSHRLNLGVNLHKRTRRGNESIWNFSIYNAYNAMNPNFILCEEKYNEETHEYEGIQLNKLSILPIIPAFSYTYIF
ncbi:MAG: TonB-dependent receptor [Bacteroidales bacterium]|nr:TonB-dependent receptor [Bacteroidales bacterium]